MSSATSRIILIEIVARPAPRIDDRLPREPPEQCRARRGGNGALPLDRNDPGDRLAMVGDDIAVARPHPPQELREGAVGVPAEIGFSMTFPISDIA